MKKLVQLILIIYATLFYGEVNAQVTISIRQPLSYQLKVSYMFNADLINVSGQNLRIYLKGTIINMKTNQLVVDAKSEPLDLVQGAKTINANMVSPAYNYYNDAGNVSTTGQLPYGNYQICLKAYSLPDNEEKGAECITEEISPLSPPLLLNPDNGAEIIIKNPLLVWLPPTPVNRDMRVLYDLKLVEIMPNQTPYDAVQRNFSLLEQKDIRTTNLQYPANAVPLEEGKTYAWQITAKTDQYLIGQTEVWTFKYKKMDSTVSDDIAVNENYMIPKKQLDAGITYIGKTLKVLLTGFAGNIPLYEIYDSKNKRLNIDAIDIISEGDGKYVFNLAGCSQLKHRQSYYMVIITSKGDKGYIPFQYIKKN